MCKFIIFIIIIFIGGLPLYPQAYSEKPNVIIIYTDDQGYEDLNIYGSKDLLTPSMDSLATSGVRFTQFYAAAPVCSPSRASLLTGRYPQRAKFAGNASSEVGSDGMPGEQFTIAELFKTAGYVTGHIGKWHLGYSKETMPNAQGFDYSFGFMGGCIDNYSHFFYWYGPNRHDLWRNGEEVYQPGAYFPDLMVEEATNFMERNRENPFFMYWALNIPHYPLQGEKKWLDYYKDLPSPRNKYAALISTMDDKVGMLLRALDSLGLTQNTIIIFQSDHGFSREERTFGGGGSAGIYRGSKFSLFEGGVRVPSFISWPGKIPKNEIRDQFAANIDWMPTLAEYCNIPLPARIIDGKSLVPVISSTDAPTTHHSFYWQNGGSKKNPQWAVRDENWKLLHKPYEAKPKELDKKGFFLVNLAEDPPEQHNLSQKYPQKVKELKEKYTQWIKEVYEQ